MPDREDFSRALREAIAGVSVRALAERAGWGRSTIQDWLHGARVPSRDQLSDVLDAAGVTAPDIRQKLADLHAEVAVGKEMTSSRQSGQQITHIVNEGEPDKRTWRRLWFVPVVAFSAAVCFFAGFATGRATAPVDEPRRVAMEARIANTEGLGVYSHQGPSDKTPKNSSYADGDIVGVVCVVTAVPVRDDTMKSTRSVWALLATGDWVPDLYLDLDKSWTPPQPPPPPLVAC